MCQERLLWRRWDLEWASEGDMILLEWIVWLSVGRCAVSRGTSVNFSVNTVGELNLCSQVF